MISALTEYRQSRAHELCYDFKIMASHDFNEHTPEYVTDMYLWIQENLELKTYNVLITVNGYNHTEVVGIDIEFYNEITAIAFKLAWE